jgi:RNA polymerase sigma-70 factor, ECF subfamily
MDAAEKLLVARSREGDVRAFERLVGPYLSSVRRFARAFASTHEAATVLAQDALVEAYLSVEGVRGRAPFSAWLYGVARRVCLEHARKLQEPPNEVMPRPDPRAVAWGALATVPPDIRASLVLYDLEGFTYEEIAVIEKTSLPAVKSRVSRGRDHFLRALGASTPASPTKSTEPETH